MKQIKKEEEPYIFITIGLPSRGKSYLCKNLQKFFSKKNYDCRIFNLGDIRRKKEVSNCDFKYFKNTSKREIFAKTALEHVIQFFDSDEEIKKIGKIKENIVIEKWNNNKFEQINLIIEKKEEIKKKLKNGKKNKNNDDKVINEKKIKTEMNIKKEKNQINLQKEKKNNFKFKANKKTKIALYDGTNSTLQRRNLLRKLLKNKKYKIIWIELKSENKQKIEKYVKKSKLEKDYKNINKKKAYEDFMKRISEYKKCYEKFSDFEIENIKNDFRRNFILISEFGRNICFENFTAKFKVCEDLKFFLENEYNCDD